MKRNKIYSVRIRKEVILSTKKTWSPKRQPPSCFAVQSAAEPAGHTLLKRVFTCAFVCGTPTRPFSPFRRAKSLPDGVDFAPSMSKPLEQANFLLNDRCHTHCTGIGTCASEALRLVSDHHRKSASKVARNRTFPDGYLSSHPVT